MTTTTERLDRLRTQIEALNAGITEQQEGYAALVAAGHEDKADKLAAKMRNDRERLEVLGDRIPVLEGLIEQEEKAARVSEGRELAAQADAKLAEAQERFERLAVLAREFSQAVNETPENYAFEWYLLARKARELGAVPSTAAVGDSEAFGSLTAATRAVRNMAGSFGQQVYQLNR